MALSCGESDVGTFTPPPAIARAARYCPRADSLGGRRAGPHCAERHVRAAAQRRLDSDDRGSSASAATGDGRHALEGAQSAVGERYQNGGVWYRRGVSCLWCCAARSNDTLEFLDKSNQIKNKSKVFSRVYHN